MRSYLGNFYRQIGIFLLVTLLGIKMLYLFPKWHTKVSRWSLKSGEKNFNKSSFKIVSTIVAKFEGGIHLSDFWLKSLQFLLSNNSNKTCREPWSSGYGRRLVFKGHGFESIKKTSLFCVVIWCRFRVWVYGEGIWDLWGKWYLYL